MSLRTPAGPRSCFRCGGVQLVRSCCLSEAQSIGSRQTHLRHFIHPCPLACSAWPGLHVQRRNQYCLFGGCQAHGVLEAMPLEPGSGGQLPRIAFLVNWLVQPSMCWRSGSLRAALASAPSAMPSRAACLREISLRACAGGRRSPRAWCGPQQRMWQQVALLPPARTLQ